MTYASTWQSISSYEIYDISSLTEFLIPSWKYCPVKWKAHSKYAISSVSKLRKPSPNKTKLQLRLQFIVWNSNQPSYEPLHDIFSSYSLALLVVPIKLYWIFIIVINYAN